MTPAEWTVAAAGLQALATVGLLAVTFRYARTVDKQARAARKSADASRRSAEATERMAKLQAREAREETLSTLHDLSQDLHFFKSKLLSWKEPPPNWRQMKLGDAPDSPGLPQDRIQKAQQDVSGLYVDQEERVTLRNAFQKLSGFQELATTVREAHRDGDPNPDAVRELEEEFRATQGALLDAIDVVDKLSEEIR